MLTGWSKTGTLITNVGRLQNRPLARFRTRWIRFLPRADDGFMFKAISSLRRRPALGLLLTTIALTIGYELYNAEDATTGFDKFILVKREPVSSTASLFYLEPKVRPKTLQIYQDAWKKGIWNVQFKQPQIQVVRSYTPLPPLGREDGTPTSQGQLRFLIRHERQGEVSGWLHRLPIGSEIELRGPNIEFEVTAQTNHIIFLAGGTGIASALQAAHALLSHEGHQHDAPDKWKDNAKISILWANRSRDDCVGGINPDLPNRAVPGRWTLTSWFSSPPIQPTRPASPEKGPIVKDLEALSAAHPGQVTVEYFVDSERTLINKAAILKALTAPTTVSPSTNSFHPTETQIIISGPEGFTKYLAGPRIWQNGREEQGPVIGVVKEALLADPRPIKVWKV